MSDSIPHLGPPAGRVARHVSVPVDPALGFSHVSLELSVPTLPPGAQTARFSEHVIGPSGVTDTVVAPCGEGGLIAVSPDLGNNWELKEVPVASGVELFHSFTTDEGLHLIQARGNGHDAGTELYVLDQEWRLLDELRPSMTCWHGSRSIDQSGSTVIFGEYPKNFIAGRPTPGALESRSRLLRSPDGGRHWDSVLEFDAHTIRHFHTVVADQFRPGRWWASSGDRPEQCLVWESCDDGVTWEVISPPEPEVEVHPSGRAQSVFRHTDLVVRESDVIWGADDFLGDKQLVGDPHVPVRQRVGARIFRAAKEAPWLPEPIGYVGEKVHSIIDAGPAYIVATQGKGAVSYCPLVFLLSKDDPPALVPLAMMDNFATRKVGTTFTTSRASRRAKDGVFFSYRQRTDVFNGGPMILRWRIDFG